MSQIPKADSTQWGWLVLFASMGTLLCCALPMLLVTLGMGAVMASLASNLPFLVTLSQYKVWTFTASGFLLVLSAIVLFRSGRMCPTDPGLAVQCERARYWNTRLFWVAVVIWLVGLATTSVGYLLD